MNAQETTWQARLALTAACAAALALFTVHYQISFMGFDWHERVNWERIQQVVHGEAGNPWQYRVLSESMVFATVKAFQAMGIPRPIGTAFVVIRLLQNAVLFVLAVYTYRRLGLTLMESILGISLLAWGMCHALYDGDLTFNTYTDVGFFLAAALLILRGKYAWLIPLMLVAPFNRETSGCIPFLFLFARVRADRPWIDRRDLAVFLICLLAWAVVTAGLRWAIGPRPNVVPTAGVEPILPLLTYNLTWPRTWIFLFATLGLLPIFAVVSWRGWPPVLKRLFWAIVPVWFPVHFCLAHAPETRLFLAPFALVFIPGALFGIRWWGRETRTQETIQ